MSIGRSGRESHLERQSTKTRGSCKTHCCRARSTEQREEDTVDERPISKTRLIKILAQAIQQITEMDDGILILKEGKLKFRQYERIDCNWDQLRAIVTIEI